METGMNRIRVMGALLVALMPCLALAGGASTQSALFSGTNANLWLMDEQGRVTSYSYEGWLSAFIEGDTYSPLAPGELAIINEVPFSSVSLSAGQPALSLVGLGRADILFNQSGAAGQAPLELVPASGTYHETVVVRMGVASEWLAEGRELHWQVVGTHPQSGSVVLPEPSAATTASGYVHHPIYLIHDAAYTLTVTLMDGSDVLAEATANYLLQSNHEDGFRRDSSGNGIPDIVQAAIGLDPYNPDWQVDSNGNGWGDFDEWLREGFLDENRVPVDTDGDGWPDIDEIWRGTNPNDPEVLPANPDDPESLRQWVLKFKDFPAARRLYEVEHIVTGHFAPAPAVADMHWERVVGATARGQLSYQSRHLVSDEDLGQAGLAASELAPRRLQAVADAALALGDLPPMRLPAGDSVVIAGVHRHSGDEDMAGVRQVYKVWLPREGDATPLRFSQEADQKDWMTADEWRQAYTGYLAETLTREVDLTPSVATTAEVALLEAMVSDEARRRNQGDIVLFGHPDQPVSASLMRTLERDLDAISVLVESGPRTLDHVIEDLLQAMTADDSAIGQIQDWVQAMIESPAPGRRSDRYVAERFIQGFDPDALGCYLSAAQEAIFTEDPAAYDNFIEACPVYYRDDDLAALRSEDQARRYQLRLFWLPDAQDHIDQDGTLLDRLADSDGDGLINGLELAGPLSSITLPWLADTDGDGIPDGSDLCPRDPLNLCGGEPRLPQLQVDGQLQVMPDGLAVIAITLDRPAVRDVVLFYSTAIPLGSSAVAGRDFIPVESGRLTIAAGERTALLWVEIPAEAHVGTDIHFTVVFEQIMNAELVVQDPVATVTVLPFVPEAPTLILPGLIQTYAGQTTRLDASASLSPSGEPLIFQWSLLDDAGLMVALEGADSAQAQFVAPDVSEPRELVFEVMATTAWQVSDNQTLTVRVNPLPPLEVTGEIIRWARLGEPLAVGRDELLGQVSGEGPLAIAGTMTPPDYGQGTLNDQGLVYQATVSPEVDIAAGQLSDLTVIDEQRLAFLDAASNQTPVVYHWPSRQSVALSIFGVDRLVANHTPDATVYALTSSVPTAMLRWSADLGERPGELSIWPATATADPLHGGLFACGSATNTWQWVEREFLQAHDLVVPCAADEDVRLAVWKQQVCLAQHHRLVCGTGPEGLAEVTVNLPQDAQIRRLQAVDAGLLVTVTDIPNANGIEAALMLWPGSGEPAPLMVWTQDSWRSPAQVVSDGDAGVIMLQGDSNGRLTLSHWAGKPGQLPELLLELDGNPGFPHWLGELRWIQSDLLWSIPQDDRLARLSRVEWPGGELQPVADYFTQPGVAHWLIEAFEVLHTLEAGLSEDRCQLVRRQVDELTIVLPELDCHPLLPLPEMIAYSLSKDGKRQLIQYQDLTDTFTVAVSDSFGREVQVPVTIRILAR